MPETDEKAKELTDFKTLILTSILTALALVVGLFWNDAIKSAIEEILPAGQGLFYKFLAAIIVTIFVVIVVFIFVRGHKIAEKRLKEMARAKKAKKGIFKI